MRKKQAGHRPVTPDPKYNDVIVSEFINCVMKQGKKHLARSIVYDALDLIEQRTKNPGIEVRARRVGGATYQVPTEVRQDRSIALAIRWLISYASDRKDKSMSEKLAAEFIAASNGEGSAIKKKEDVHKMAEANKAFAHFKW
jgi:small subunit ribosomal protein S7